MNLLDLYKPWDQLSQSERFLLVKDIRRDRRVNKYIAKEKETKKKKVSKDLDAILQLPPDKAREMLKRFQEKLENGK